jgi:hypothetical protein
MNRFTFGFLAGLLTMYFCDPQHGAIRRARWADWWSRNEGTLRATAKDIVSTGRQVAEASEQLGRQVARMTSAAGSRVRARLGH